MTSSVQIIDGKTVAARVRAEVAEQVGRFRAQYGRAPGLHVVIAGDDPASHIYVRNKEKAARDVGIDGVVHRLDASCSPTELCDLVDRLCSTDTVDGLLVQLPLPRGIDPQPVLDRLDPWRDVDGLHTMNAGMLFSGRQGLRPCTPMGCMRLIAETGTDPKGMRAVVLGRSNLVGKPLAMMLLEKHATVTMAHSRTRDLGQVCAEADILIAAVGQPHLVKGDWVKQGAIVIDVGTSRGEDGKLVGDVEFEAAKLRARAITPVPGGVGPMTIAYLLSNTVQAAIARMASK